MSNRIFSVVKSTLTLEILKQIDINKSVLKLTTQENKLLKKLCFHKGLLHEKAVSRLQENAAVIKEQLTQLEENKRRFRLSYNTDYENTVNGKTPEPSFKEESAIYVPVVISNQDQREKMILEIYNESQRSNVNLGVEVFKAIRKELRLP